MKLNPQMGLRVTLLVVCNQAMNVRSKEVVLQKNTNNNNYGNKSDRCVELAADTQHKKKRNKKCQEKKLRLGKRDGQQG